jgi:hypothetical protein
VITSPDGFMWVLGVGRVDCRPNRLPPVHRPDPEPRHVDDPEAERIRIAERVHERMRVDPPWPDYPAWPAPEVPMRVIAAGSLPSAPAKLLSKLRSASWVVVVTYARGSVPDAQRRPGRVVGSFALRCRRGDRRAVAIWWQSMAGKLETQGVLVWGDRAAEWIGVQEFERGL